MKTCKNAKRYQGKRYPTCNNGNPCETCLKTWNKILSNDSKIHDLTIFHN